MNMIIYYNNNDIMTNVLHFRYVKHFFCFVLYNYTIHNSNTSTTNNCS